MRLLAKLQHHQHDPNIMKYLFLYFLSLIVFISVPLFVHAAPVINDYVDKIATDAGYDAGDKADTALSAKVGQVINAILGLAGMIFFALTVYAGFLWMTAAGNDEQVSKATDIIKMAVIGLAITLAAYSITFFVVSSIGASTNSNSSANLNTTTTN